MEIFLKTEDEILLVKRASQLVSKTLAELATIIRPGISTLQLDTLAENFIRDHGGIPILKDFPNSIFVNSACENNNNHPDRTVLCDILNESRIIRFSNERYGVYYKIC